jgi:hypothetical protein
MEFRIDEVKQPGVRTAGSGGVALATVVSFLLTLFAPDTSVSVTAVGGALVAATLLLGPAAAAGGAAGVLVHDIFAGAVGYWTLASVVWIVVFAGGVAWLVPTLLSAGDRESSGQSLRASLWYVAAVVIACLHATALAAWTTSVSGGERFYTTVPELLPGVVFAVGIGVPLLVLLSGRPGRRFEGAVGSRRRLVFSVRGWDTETLTRRNGSTRRTVLGLFGVGFAWVCGATTLDLLAHDLGQFVTVSQLQHYVTPVVGRDSPLATVVTAVLVGVYRYGELATALSAPAAAVVVWLLSNRDRRSLPPVAQRLVRFDREVSDD